MSTVYLTFDDGPNGGTNVTLDVLKAAGAVATFFLSGDNPLSDDQEKIRLDRMFQDLHQLGSHCFKHKPDKKSEYESAYGDLTDPIKQAAFKKNITDNLDHFRAVTGNPSLNFPLVRLPGNGSFHAPSVKEVAKLGYTHISWNFELAPNGKLPHVNKQDWQGIAGVSATDVGLPKSNAIILAHDHHWVGSAHLLAAVLKKLTDKGFTFAPVAQQPIA